MAVSQAPVVSEAPAAVAPPVGGVAVAALPSAVQDLARFFFILAGSSSLGAVDSVKGAAAPASGVGVRLCPSALDGEAAPFGAASSLASAPLCRFHARFSRPAVAIGRAYRSMVVVIARPHVVPGVEFWQPGDLSWSPVRSALWQVRSSRSSSESFEVVQAGFLPPTAGCSLIGGTSACSGPFLRVTALLSGLRAGDCGLPLLRMDHARVWMVACPPWERRAAATLVPLMPWASAGISFRSILASSRLSLSWWIRRACAGLLLPRPLGACWRPLRLFTGRLLLATVVSS